MKHLMMLNEFINNINNLEYFVNKLKTEIENTIGRNLKFNLTFSGGKKITDDKPYSYNLLITGDIVSKETKNIEKCLDKYIKIFDKEGLFFDYKSSSFAESRAGVITYSYDCIIKNNNVLRAKPEKLLYHTSNPKNRESIMKNGLLPTSNKNWVQILWYKPAIFASKNFERLFRYHGNDIWVIDTTNLKNKWWVDLNVNLYTSEHDDYIMTYEPIPPEHLKLYNNEH